MNKLGTRLLAGFCLMLATLSAMAEPGVTDNHILLGMSSPFTGPNGAYGTEMKEGALAYFAQVNAAGGVNGRKIELVALDDGYETDRTVLNTKKLINDNKVFALFAYYGSSPTTEAMKVFAEARVPLVGTISGADSLREPVNRYMFNLRASYADETESIVSHLVSLGVKNIAVFYQDDGFGKSGLEGVNRAMKRFKLAPVAVATVPRNSVAVGPAVATIAKANPQAVIMVTLYKPTAAFIREMRATGLIPQFSTLSPVGADLLVKELNNDSRGIGISQVMPYPWNDTTPIVRDYQKALFSFAKHKNYSYYGIEGYINAKLMVEAIKHTGKDLTREKLVTALESVSDLDLGGFHVAYSPGNHNGSRYVDLTVIGNNGRVLR